MVLCSLDAKVICVLSPKEKELMLCPNCPWRLLKHKILIQILIFIIMCLIFCSPIYCSPPGSSAHGDSSPPSLSHNKQIPFIFYNILKSWLQFGDLIQSMAQQSYPSLLSVIWYLLSRLWPLKNLLLVLLRWKVLCDYICPDMIAISNNY